LRVELNQETPFDDVSSSKFSPTPQNTRYSYANNRFEFEHATALPIRTEEYKVAFVKRATAKPN
jgi:hypothetical protein